MPPKLRTVIDLDTRLWSRAREVAFRRKVSMSYLVNLALRDFLGMKIEIKQRRAGRPRKKSPPPARQKDRT